MSFRNLMSVCVVAANAFVAAACSTSDVTTPAVQQPSAPAAPVVPGIDPTLIQSRGFVWSRETGTQEIPLPSYAYGMVVTGINNAGQVVGYITMDVFLEGNTRAFTWSQASGYVELGSLVGPYGFSAAVAINDAGVVSGVSNGPSSIELPGYGGDFDLRDPFVWTADSGIKPIDGLSDISAILQINGAGSVLAQSRGRYYLWNATTGVRTLAFAAGPTGTSCSAPVDLNDNGRLLGYAGEFAANGGCSKTSALTWNADGTQVPIDQWQCDVNHVPCGIELIAINNRGEVTGNRPVLGISGLPDAGTLPFRWTPTSGFVKFPNNDAHPKIRASDINDNGDIAGTVTSADPTRNGATTPFVWLTSGEVINLPLPRGARSAGATHINDRGQVVGMFL